MPEVGIEAGMVTEDDKVMVDGMVPDTPQLMVQVRMATATDSGAGVMVVSKETQVEMVTEVEVEAPFLATGVAKLGT